MDVRKWLLLPFIGLMIAINTQAQTDCGIVDSINFPIDPAYFRLSQDYAVPSMRHQGRYHTGEDWYGGRDVSLGQAVRAIARGRVLYSYPQGWGRDGGVVIIEHTFPDGTLIFTQYGHMMATDAYPFPERLSCVEMGDVIGAIGSARPAPHLHFEVRISDGLSPGAGYTRENPYANGYRNPSKFIINQQIWLSLWHEWHITVGSETVIDEQAPSAPLLVLNDNSLLYLDGTGSTLRRATRDGRVLWRARFESPAVAIDAYQGASLLTFADGTLQIVDVESGVLGDRWRVDAQFTGAPTLWGDVFIYPAVNDSIVLISANRREVVRRITGIPSYQQALGLDDGRIAFVTDDQRLLIVNSAGDMIEDVALRAGASLAQINGQLIAYTQGGLWQIDPSGTWSLFIASAPVRSQTGTLLTTQEYLYLFDGQRVSAYNQANELVWQAPIPTVTGLTRLTQYDDLLLLTSNGGNLILLTSEGRYCNQAQIYGRVDANQWQALGNDGILRIAIADQILGMNWASFSRPCRV